MATNLVYLAMPIDFAKGTDQPFLAFAEDDLKASGHVVYRPDRSFSFFTETQPSGVIQAVNNAAIREASALLAFLPANVQTVGVPMEIQAAVSTGKPVLIVTDHAQSWAVAGWESHPLVQVAEFNAGQIREGVGWLNKMIEADPVAFGAEIPAQRGVQPPVVFEAMTEGAQLPTRAYETDAGFDLYVSETTYVPAGGLVVDIPSGVALQINPGEWALITGRSSTIRKKRLHVVNGVIDAGYRGELFAGVQNLNSHAVTIEKGERVAQIILMGAAASGRTAVLGKVADAPRGANGFGSSGR